MERDWAEQRCYVPVTLCTPCSSQPSAHLPHTTLYVHHAPANPLRTYPIHNFLFTMVQLTLCTLWFKHILFITRHDKEIGQSKKLCFALSSAHFTPCITFVGLNIFYFISSHMERDWAEQRCHVSVTLCTPCSSQPSAHFTTCITLCTPCSSQPSAHLHHT